MMYLSKRIFLLCVFVILLNSHNCLRLLCSQILTPEDDECYCHESSAFSQNNSVIFSTKPPPPSELRSNHISFHLNARTGELNVSFKLPVPHCKYDSFQVTLYVHKNICTNHHDLSLESENDNMYDKHSERIYHIRRSKPDRTSAACQEYAQVTFLHIYTGCYYVEITPNISGTKRRHVKSIPHLLETRIKKSDVELIVDQNNSVSVSQNSQTSITMQWPFKSLPRKMTFSLNQLDERGCQNSHNEAGLECPKNITIDCNPHLQDDEKGVMNNTFSFTCAFANITPGNYCAILSAGDDRYKEEVWESHNSLWHHYFEVKKSAPDGKVQLPSTHTNLRPVWVVMGLVVTATFIALLYGLYERLTIARQCPNQQNLTLEEGATDPLLNNQEQKILLLYARDCAPFMELMSSFRELLQNYCECEVLDCYDEDNQQEIFTREHDWLLGQMNQVPLKVVLVATECLAAHQLAQLGSRGVVEYHNPDPCDKIFPLALKLLKEDVNPGLYNRVKLVEFSGFQITNESLTLFPTPFVRYTLPHGFKDLICSLCQYASTAQLNDCDDDMKGIGTRLDDLLQYKKINPRYLQTIIT